MLHERPAVATKRVVAQFPSWLRSRSARIGLGVALVLLLALAVVATLPVGFAKNWIEQRLSERAGAPVSIGSLSREPFFSFSPTIVVGDLRVAQPEWAGSGALVQARTLRLQIPLLPALIGRGLRPRGIAADGLVLSLVRDANGRANWSSGKAGRPLALSDLTVTNGRFTLADAKRHLRLAGTLSANDTAGLTVRAKGRFRDADARLDLHGGAITSARGNQPYPLRLTFESPLLHLAAAGSTDGPLNIRAMTLDIRAQAPSLKYLDDVIEAGLFGTQPINLTATVRHRDHDWLIDGIGGSIGRSRFAGEAEVLKRDGRTKIDARLDFSQFDFDDLADDQGLAEQAALAARIGPRVLPNTRINLSKVGPTDGTIRFVARRLLFKEPSVFRSLQGTVSLQGKLLRLDDVQARLTNGQMTGRMVVDHRSGTSPLLRVDLLFSDGRLGPLLNAQDKIDAPFRARVALSGRGDTVRAALSRADGHAGITAGSGHVVRIAAAVLAQDMGKTIGAALADHDETVPLHCMVLGLEARQGRLTAAPFLIETAVARSRGTGTIDLDGERIALTIGGRAREASGLPMVDPILIGGTLSDPQVTLSSLGNGKKDVGTILGAVVKSIGGALGLADKKGPAVTATGPIDCAALMARALRAPAGA